MISDYGLYPVITSKFCKGRKPLDVLKAVIKGGVKIVQLREKEMTKKDLYDLAVDFRKITKRAGVTLIINDHIDIALAVKADGIHLGQDDLPCKVARKLGPSLIIGISTHDREEIVKAEIDGASYINVGPIFATGTKQLSMEPLGLDYLKDTRTSLPFTVMGGIKENNIKDVLECGAKTIAMVTELTEAENIIEKTKRLTELINHYRENIVIKQAY